MIAALVVSVETNRHKVQKLCSIPIVKKLRITPDEISTNENIHNTADKRHFFSKRDSLGIVPTLSKPVNTLAHLLSVSV